MLAATTGELRLVVPMWGSILIAVLGAVYLVIGGRWPRLFDVLSMTVLGCAIGLVACAWVPLAQPLVIIIGGVILGGLTAFFRPVSHAVLAGIVLAAVFATLAALAVGRDGFTSYLVVSASDRSFSTQVRGPSLACDPVLAAGLVGLLAGATIAVARFQFSQRLTPCVQGAGLIVVGMGNFLTAWRGENTPSLATAFPLTLAALWLCLVVIGLIAQSALARPQAPGDETADEPAEEEA